MAEAPGIDIESVTPEDFVGLVSNADDAQVAEVVRAVGAEEVLDRVFEGMQERFIADKAKGVDAVIQFVITDEGKEYPYAVEIKDATCVTRSGKADSPKSTITTDLVSFCRLISGQAEGTQMFMQGKLKVAGDIMFSAQTMTFFERPKPVS